VRVESEYALETWVTCARSQICGCIASDVASRCSREREREREREKLFVAFYYSWSAFESGFRTHLLSDFLSRFTELDAILDL
jgi:hypothetical protein